MSDVVWQGLIAAWVTITLALINLWTARKAAVKVEEVRDALTETTRRTDDKLDGLADVAKDTHTLVNSRMGMQLRLTAIALRRIANDSKNADDISAAEIAEQLLAEHETMQKAVDKEVRTR